MKVEECCKKTNYQEKEAAEQKIAEMVEGFKDLQAHFFPSRHFTYEL